MISTASAFRHPSATQGVVDIRPVYKYSSCFPRNMVELHFPCPFKSGMAVWLASSDEV